MLTHNEEFPGKLLPFGCNVIFKPIERRADSGQKIAPPTVAGILAGYTIIPGYGWNSEYLVWSPSYIATVDLN